MAKNITCEIKKSLAVLSENGRGYTKEANLVSWNSANAKLDIREWHPGHDRCGEGISLLDSEARKLMEVLIKLYK